MKRDKFPSPHSLYAFEAAARTCSFSRAAESLGISQPAISRSIAALEEEIGEKLFIRSGPRLKLTDSGEELGRITRSAFRAIENLIESWDHRKASRETVLLSISSSMAALWLIPRLADFRAAFPDVDLRFELIPGGVGTEAPNADLGLRLVRKGVDNISDSFYMQELIQPVASPSYLSKFGSLDEPVRGKVHTLIGLSDHWCSWAEYAKRINQHLPEHELLVFSDYAVVLQTAISGQGIALSWLSVTTRLLLNNSLHAASSSYLQTGDTYDLMARGGKFAKSTVLAVRDWMVSQAWADVDVLRKRRITSINEARLSLPKHPVR